MELMPAIGMRTEFQCRCGEDIRERNPAPTSRRLDASPLSSRRSAWLTSAAVAGAHNHWLTAGPRQTTEIASVFPTSIGGGSKHRCVDDDE
ncbi:hypothetical protein CMV_002591 [Castanea mollissima]|uniref:Uncharacterized protein n=1 Tax=Castanea mollissima TaxID=60419 RepID=A0A8J4RIX7_9ROSI|nr:hypothetical protein CMV_002591 [Castanea mollissima]